MRRDDRLYLEITKGDNVGIDHLQMIRANEKIVLINDDQINLKMFLGVYGIRFNIDGRVTLPSGIYDRWIFQDQSGYPIIKSVAREIVNLITDGHQVKWRDDEGSLELTILNRAVVELGL